MKKLYLTFEQITPHLHKWAKRFCSKYFDYNELINSAWAYGGVRFLPQSKIKCASKRIKYDMLDYMRVESGTRRKSCFHNESGLRSWIEGADDFWNTIEIKSRDENIEQKDFINFFTNHPSLSRKEKLIMKLIYIEGYTHEETGRVCGVVLSRISQIHNNLIERFRSLDYSKVL